MAVSKYEYNDIKKIINNNEYEIKCFTIKYNPLFDGKLTKDIIDNNEYITYYHFCKNDNYVPVSFKPNSTKEELLKIFDKLINILENE